MGEEKLQEVVNKLKRLKSFVSEKMDEVVELNAKGFEDEARRTLAIGENPYGKKLEYQKLRFSPTGSNGYTVAYTKYKDKRGGNTGYVNLKLSGDFWESIRLTKVEKNNFVFTSEDEKYPYLNANYGDVLGVKEQILQAFTTKQLEPRINFLVNNYIM